MMKNRRILSAAAALLVLACFTTALKSDRRNFDISRNLNIYATLLRNVDMLYVDEIDPEKLVETSIDAMLSSLDPYTVYYPESKTEELKLMTTGEYAGIGSLIGQKDGNVIIREPYTGSPAADAGLLPGDIIVSVDGKPATGKTTDEVSSMLKGKPGQEICIRVRRKYQDKILEIKTKREKIQMPCLPYYGMAGPTTGYIALHSFTDKSAECVRKALFNLKEYGATSLILDLRGNGGGLLDQAVDIVNFFVPKDTRIVSTKGKVTQWNREYRTARNPIFPDLPLVVLIDRESASASEIVSGSLQDLDRAVLIGERSFGKGLVQNVRDLVYNTKIKVTTSKYYIPSGRCIQALDYSHRNPDGSVARTPDSLANAFFTVHGRKVYDGGGITPDITVKRPIFHRISQKLVVGDYLFDFVNDHALRDGGIAEVRKFSITPALYDEFKEFLRQDSFRYETDSQHLLKELEKATRNDRYYDRVKDIMGKLGKELSHSLDRDMEIHRREIQMLMEEEFIRRYYRLEGVVEYRSLHDPEIRKALEILSDRKGYGDILKS